MFDFININKIKLFYEKIIDEESGASKIEKIPMGEFSAKIVPAKKRWLRVDELREVQAELEVYLFLKKNPEIKNTYEDIMRARYAEFEQKLPKIAGAIAKQFVVLSIDNNMGNSMTISHLKLYLVSENVYAEGTHAE